MIVFLRLSFMFDGFPMPYRQDRNRNGGGIMIYIRDDIPSKLLRKRFSRRHQRFICRIELQKK